MDAQPGDTPRSNRSLVAAIWGLVVVVVIGLVAFGTWASPGTPQPAAPASAWTSPPTATTQTYETVVDAPPLPAHPIGQRDWLLVDKDPVGHSGARLIVFGRVEQFDSVTGTGGFVATVDGVRHSPGYQPYPTLAFVAGDPAAFSQLVQGDGFTAEITVDGVQHYTNTSGAQAQVTRLVATSIRSIS